MKFYAIPLEPKGSSIKIPLKQPGQSHTIQNPILICIMHNYDIDKRSRV